MTPISLSRLEAQFLQIDPNNDRVWHCGVPMEDAQGVAFLCPRCFVLNEGRVGTHHIICWFAGRRVPDHLSPGPGRWTPAGTDMETLTLNGATPGGSRSVLLTAGCGAHFFVTGGSVHE